MTSRLHRDPADQNAAVPPIHDGMEGEPMANDAGTGGQSWEHALLALAEAADTRETELMAELSGLDQFNITLVALVRRAMLLIPEGKSLWWDEAKAAIDFADAAALLPANIKRPPPA